MRYCAALLIVVAACSSHSDPERAPLKVTLSAPSVVTGTWSLIDTSRVLTCAYDLTAGASGGRGDDTVEWTGATITLEAPPALAATQEHPAARVAGWFNRPVISTGESATARINIGRDRPFTAEHQFRYRRAGGTTSSAVATVQCRAP